MAEAGFTLVDARGRKYLTGEERARDVDLAASELRFRTLKRRKEHWRAVPVPEELTRELALVHGMRRAQSRPRSAAAALWPFTRPTASRHIAALRRAAAIEGPQACPKGLRHAYGVAAAPITADACTTCGLKRIGHEQGARRPVSAPSGTVTSGHRTRVSVSNRVVPNPSRKIAASHYTPTPWRNVRRSFPDPYAGPKSDRLLALRRVAIIKFPGCGICVLPLWSPRNER